MTDILITSAILATKRTPAEKMLLARICQRAAQSRGICSDSNNDLALATAIHLKTVSDLINRLAQAQLLQVSVDKEQANKRLIAPRPALLVGYPVSTDSTLGNSGTPYPVLTDSPPVTSDRPIQDYPSKPDSPLKPDKRRPGRQSRLCPMTGVDITHQRPNCRLASRLTFQNLQRKEPEQFALLVGRFLRPGEQGGLTHKLADQIRKLAREEQSSILV